MATWFVISGTQGSDRIFYERHLLSHGGEMTEGLVMSYPAGLKQKYDPIVARMAKSFHAPLPPQSICRESRVAFPAGERERCCYAAVCSLPD